MPKLCLRLAFTSSLLNKHPNNPHYTGWFRRKNILVGDSACHGKKNVHMNMYLIPNGYRDRAVWIWRVLFLTFLFVGLKSELCKRKVDTRDELLDPILDATARTKETWKSTHAKSLLSNKLILYTYDVISHYCIFLLLHTSLRMAGEETETCRRITKCLYVTVSNTVQLLEYRLAWWLVWLHETFIIFNMQLNCYSTIFFLGFQRGFLPHFIILNIIFDTCLIWQLPYVH